MTILLTILHILVCVFLVLVVLTQQGKGQDLASAFGGAGTQAAFGARGTATLLTKVTAGTAATFMITSLLLGYVGSDAQEQTVVDDLPAGSVRETAPPQPVPDAPPAEAVPDEAENPDEPGEPPVSDPEPPASRS